MRAMRRFGVATQQEIRLRAYGLSIPDAKALLARLVADGRLTPVDLALDRQVTSTLRVARGAWRQRSHGAADHPAVAVRSAGLRPRPHRAAVRLQLQARDVQAQGRARVRPLRAAHPPRQRAGRAARLASATARSNELVVRKLHWEGGGQPKAATRRAVDAAIADLAAFVQSGLGQAASATHLRGSP